MTFTYLYVTTSSTKTGWVQRTRLRATWGRESLRLFSILKRSQRVNLQLWWRSTLGPPSTVKRWTRSSMSTSRKSSLSSRQWWEAYVSYEFGGPAGTAAMMIGFPLLMCEFGRNFEIWEIRADGQTTSGHVCGTTTVDWSILVLSRISGHSSREWVNTSTT